MRTTSAPLIRLKNYSPPSFTIDTVNLDVRFDPEHTWVKSQVQVKRAKTTATTTPLVLDGDELTLMSVSVNGKPTKDYKVSDEHLTISNLPKTSRFSIEIETELSPVTNTKLMGLYQSNGIYCTQCEAEGFRRITYFPDRPDVLATYTVRLEGDRETCPVLLSNGNLGKKGKLKNNRHYAIWHDPHPKPCYLFAMVAGDLDVYSDKFKTASSRKVDLNIYVEKGKADMAHFAMDALKRSIVWDEEKYGCEYDLDVFNIVAVSDFNMGAMENKGLNVFNDKYVLANPEVATDTDYMHIEAIIAHEYFHNWSGNRITCRDWFQLCLKEGLTVYRDQEFSADTRSRGVQRIQQVRVLKAGQFPEDSGPLAHPVRPAEYKEINNFYTATVYQKGAELVRMLATLVGPKTYRKATDLYFKRHDGEAAMVEDFLKCFEDAGGLDLSQFAVWYAQAGTPSVAIKDSYDKAKQRYTLELTQELAPSAGQSKKRAVPIPIKFGLLGKSGSELEFTSKNAAVQGDVIVLDKRRQKIVLENVSEKPVPSFFRNFSAPVTVDYKEANSALLHRATFDSDAYNRWQALNLYATKMLIKGSKAKPSTSAKTPSWLDSKFIEAIRDTVFDESLEPEFRAQVAAIPSVADIAREIGKNVDPDSILKARNIVTKAIGKSLGDDGLDLIKNLAKRQLDVNELEAAGLRSLKNVMLSLLVSAKVDGALAVAEKQFKTSKNMTDNLAALATIAYAQNDTSKTDSALQRFYKKFKSNPLVIDKWFSLQAGIADKTALSRVKALTKHADYTLENPNRARALLAPFAAANYPAFHNANGRGYGYYAKQILALDKRNPQIAARLLTLMNNWRMFDAPRRKMALKSLKIIATTKGLSRDTQEIVDRMIH